MKKSIVGSLLLTLAACSSQVNVSRDPSAQRKNLQVEKIDTYLGEVYEQDEDAAIQRVIGAAMGALRRDFKPPHVPRDAHAKSHGCLKASFSVNNSALPPELRVGLFASNKSYPTWVRFSNNTSDPMSHDKDLDLRGIAIKVMNVPGTKVIPAEATAQTRDFLMFASPIFFVKDIKDYAEFIKALGDGKAFQDLLFKRPRSLVQLATAQLLAKGKKNPLKLTYFSAVPFRLGQASNPARRPVKYSVTACDPKAIKNEPNGDPSRRDFMREALKESLDQRGACFLFQVQVGDPKRPDVYPVEDPSILWPTERSIRNPLTISPYKTVATLRIPKRDDFDTEERNEFCEHLSFTPWHALPEHKPLGRTNRMRLKLYEHISAYRHRANGVEKREPMTLDPQTAYPDSK